ncbi:MAG: kelch repeat-containing protein [Gemmatimonadaceae bacterium]
MRMSRHILTRTTLTALLASFAACSPDAVLTPNPRTPAALQSADLQSSVAAGTWARKADLPTAIAGAGVAVAGGRLYVIGGGSPTGSTTVVQVYDPATDSWSYKASAPSSRAYAGVDEIAGKLYAVGGCINSDCRIGVTGRLEMYDPGTDGWTVLPSLPTPRFEPATVTLQGKLYAVGGRTACPPCNVSNAVEVFDPATGLWSTRSPLPNPRAGAGYAVLNGKLWLAGGRINNTGETGLVELYDPATDTWTEKASLPTPRAYPGLSESGGRLYAVSGLTTSSGAVTTVEEYDPVSDKWTEVAPIPTARFYPTPRSINGVILVAGSGADNTPIRVVEALDAASAPPPTNTPPVAHAGSDQILYRTSPSGVSVTLDGSGSSDADGDALTYSWSRDGIEIATGVAPTVTLGLGTHSIKLTLSDDNNASDDDFVTITVLNVAPVAIAGTNQTLTCVNGAATAYLNGSGSSDLDGTITGYSWTPGGATTANATVSSPLGSTTYTLTVTDNDGATGSDQVTVTVVDGTAPAISLTVSPTELWAPNHQMVKVASGVSASDACDPSPAFTVTVTSNEPVNGLGDGDTAPDWEVVNNADGTYDVYVRAERSGTGSGRIYTITATATDGTGNVGTASGTVSVPHSKRR